MKPPLKPIDKMVSSISDLEASRAEITTLLRAWNDGDQEAMNRLAPLVNSELHRLAHHYLKKEPPEQILETGELVNEAWMRLIAWPDATWQNRAHFIGMAAQQMRRVLVDEARHRHAVRHGGGTLRISLTAAEQRPMQQSPDLLALDEALNELAAFDPRRSRIVELRFFGGLKVEEIAEVLGTSPRTVNREWSLAQAWLYQRLNKRGK